MYRPRTIIRSRAHTSLWFTRIVLSTLVLLCVSAVMLAQGVQREQPTWWFGGAVGANQNAYSGTTQMLNSGLTTPAAFHRGFGPGLYLAALAEYRIDSVWGGMLQVGYDDRRGAFNDVPCPCGENSTLSASIAYLTVEASLRIAPFSDGFYIFGGPRVGFNWAPVSGADNEFVYTQERAVGSKGEFSDLRSVVYSGQIGIGYEFALADPNALWQANLSPFISYQPYYGQDPRSVENWGVSTFRIGAELKFGSGAAIPQKPAPAAIEVIEREVRFTVRAPKAVPARRRVRESFPLRNYVFFEIGSNELPGRYVTLTKSEAASFREEQLQEVRPVSMAGRSLRQMTVYYNILNIMGDRLKRSPGAAITLTGASAQGADQGKERAETVKKYLVDIFGIDGSRITTVGREKPLVPSEVRGATKELDLIRLGDSRVDIETTSPEMLMQVGGKSHSMLKPVQIVAVVEDPLDSQVLFHVEGAKEVLASWSLEISDAQGRIQRFGPSTRDRENLSGNTILDGRAQGDYKIVLLGQTKSGKFVRKEASVRLVRREEPKKDAVRFSILFGFGESEAIARYEDFLTEVVAPLVPDSGIVVIHGHSDVIGEEEYNEFLSNERVKDAQGIIERAVATTNKRGIRFETFGFGEDLLYAPFDNYLPEGRFYNRCVIIDIVPD